MPALKDEKAIGVPVSLVVMNWNAEAHTINCLKKIECWEYPKHLLQIFVIDNASEPIGRERLRAFVDAFPENSGIEAHFVGWEKHPGVTASFTNFFQKFRDKIKGKYIMRLDNDVELSPDGLAKMVTFAEAHEDCGVLGPRNLNISDKSLMAAAIWINPWGNNNKVEDTSSPVPCDVVLGAAMFFRISALDAIGRWFEPRLYLHSEEVEICNALRKHGLMTYYFPDALVTGVWGTSTGRRPELLAYLAHRNSEIIYSEMFPWYVNWVRRVRILATLPFRCLKARSLAMLYGYLDGIRRKPLNDEWWQQQMNGGPFTRP